MLPTATTHDPSDIHSWSSIRRGPHTVDQPSGAVSDAVFHLLDTVTERVPMWGTGNCKVAGSSLDGAGERPSRSGHLFVVLCGFRRRRVHHCHMVCHLSHSPEVIHRLCCQGECHCLGLRIDQVWNGTHGYSIGTSHQWTLTGTTLCQTTLNTVSDLTSPVKTSNTVPQRQPMGMQPISSWTRRRTDDHLYGWSRLGGRMLRRCSPMGSGRMPANHGVPATTI